MPQLIWTGKEKVVNHHLDVPFHTLKAEYTYPKNGKKAVSPSGNLIIHGDNLLALKALLPQYEGRVKLIYIDPPYNTGNENWVYNDNVNDPKIKKWIGEVVGKEGEDLSRHDKWLCMMYPRLKLLQKLLREDGAIFISIDDNEQANLKLICDEIFGKKNFVANVPWRKRTAKSDVPFGVSQDYESILCYAKSSMFSAGIENSKRKYFKTDDLPNRPWRIHDLTTQRTAEERPNSFFSIENPRTGEKYPANPLRTWAITIDTFPDYYMKKRIVFPGDYNFLNISNPVLRYFQEDDIKKAGDNFGLTSVSTNLPKEVGMTQDGTKEITAIFGEKKFSYPKPSGLIEYLLKICVSGDSDCIILDSFAGSGTTAHAVLNMNKNGGNRKFILVEMEDYAETITAERVRRVISGYGEGDKKAKGSTGTQGTGGDFTYCTLGDPIFTPDGSLNPKAGEEALRRYIWYAETKTSMPDNEKTQTNKYYLGSFFNTVYYFYYEKKEKTVLDYAFLKTIKKKEAQYIIYADICTLGAEYLNTRNIRFRKIPRDIPRY
jgi:adenine-specific DNA-methyltransferase